LFWQKAFIKEIVLLEWNSVSLFFNMSLQKEVVTEGAQININDT
jgi:hypothetical protein